MPAGAADWKYPLEQLERTVSAHINQDETRFSKIDESVTEVKVDVGNLKGRLVVVGAALVLLIPVLTTIATEVVHAVRGVH